VALNPPSVALLAHKVHVYVPTVGGDRHHVGPLSRTFGNCGGEGRVGSRAGHDDLYRAGHHQYRAALHELHREYATDSFLIQLGIILVSLGHVRHDIPNIPFFCASNDRLHDRADALFIGRCVPTTRKT